MEKEKRFEEMEGDIGERGEVKGEGDNNRKGERE